jgi:hypothetical protein
MMPQAQKYLVTANEMVTHKQPDTQRILEISVTVTTGQVEKAGTDANVQLRIGGHSFVLDKPDYDDFEKGDTDHYNFPTDITLAELRKARIELSHDNSGDSAGWNVKEVALEVKFSGSSLMSLYKSWRDIGWLAKDEGPHYTTAVVLQEGTSV